jgi:hypothetical protein
VFPQGLKDLSNVLQVFFPSLAEDENVIQYTTTNELVKGQDVIHQPHKSCRGICQPERHDQPFKKALLGFEGAVFHTSVGSIGTW